MLLYLSLIETEEDKIKFEDIFRIIYLNNMERIRLACD